MNTSSADMTGAGDEEEGVLDKKASVNAAADIRQCAVDRYRCQQHVEQQFCVLFRRIFGFQTLHSISEYILYIILVQLIDTPSLWKSRSCGEVELALEKSFH